MLPIAGMLIGGGWLRGKVVMTERRECLGGRTRLCKSWTTVGGMMGSDGRQRVAHGQAKMKRAVHGGRQNGR